MNKLKSNTPNKWNGKKKDGQTSGNSYLNDLPIIFIMCILPFITRLYNAKTYLTNFAWFPNEEYNADFFLYFKEVWFIVCIIMMVIILLHGYVSKNIKFEVKRFMIPLIIYISLVFLSTIFSDYPKLGFVGVYGQYESIFVHIGYVITIIYCYNYINNKQSIRRIICCFIGSIFIMTLLGTLQTFGYDYFNTEFGIRSILPNYLKNNIQSVGLNVPSKTAYMTLYNPNYAGLYVVLVLPVVMSLLFITKNKKVIVVSSIITVMLVITMIGSGSEAAIIATLFTGLFALVFLRKIMFSKKWITITVFMLLCFILVVNGKQILTLINSILNTASLNTHTEHNLQDIKTEDEIVITYKGDLLSISYIMESDMLSLTVADSNNMDIPLKMDYENNMYNIVDTRFENIKILPIYYRELFGINVNIDGKDWFFTKETEDGTYHYINKYGKLDKIKVAESSFFTNFESFASGRGYIWSRTLPILRENLIIGSGVQTFPIEFPQQDYVGLYNNSFSEEVLTKPHSLYLQIGVESGVISLIAFLVFYAMYFISSVKLYISGKFTSEKEWIGFSIFLGTVSYMIMGLANDSTITVAPIFWCLLGIGIAINHSIVKGLGK